MKTILDNKAVLIESGNDLGMQTMNILGAKAITQDQLKELQDRVKNLQVENDDLKRDWNTKESTLKSLNDKTRDEKVATEKRLLETEFLVGEKNREIEKMREQNMQERTLNEGQIKDLQDKITWYREN